MHNRNTSNLFTSINHIIILLIMSIISACQNTTTTDLTFASANLNIVTEATTLPVTIEIADTDTKREQGLMYRQSLGVNSGMLFIFDESAPHPFWMKNTYISLDILFINANKEIIYIEENTTPLSEELITSSDNSLYVLELNAGYVNTNHVEVGHVVNF